MESKEIQPKQAETKLEQIILGFIADEADRIQYGRLTLEITVHKGKLTNLQAIEVKRSFNLNE